MVLGSSQGSGDLESRFQDLLQPIRDLTKNWDVDIASYLEDYLDEIETVQITFDDGRTTMNFAEAALLIQGTACVYSKKVEYLYALVYQVLDLLSSKKKLAKASSVDNEGNDKDAEFDNQGQDDEFLDLDDIREHTNIDVRSDGHLNETSVFCVPQTPMSLVQFNEKEKGGDPLLSRAGEVLGSRTDFKMSTSNVQSIGMMLLDNSHLSMLTDTVFNPPTTALSMDTGTMVTNPNTTLTDQNPVAIGTEDDNTMVDEGIQNMSMESNHDEPEMVADVGEPEIPQQENRKETLRKQPPPKPLVDPWEMLDPHQPDSMAEKPPKKGKTFNIPQSLEADTKKRKRKKQQPEKPTKVESVSEFCSKAYYSNATKFPSNPLKVPSFPEFERLYWIEFKRRQVVQKKERKYLADQGRYEELAEREQDNEENDVPQLPDGDDDNNVDFGLPEDIDMMHQPVDDIMERVMPMALEENSQEQDLVVSSYEDLVRHHVDGFLAQSKQYAQVTELSRRISEWEEKIVPTLSDEDQREPFDIHKYGTMVLDTIGERKQKVSFKEVAMNREKFTVCRMFLATLQLANSYNVKISAAEGLYEGMDSMELKLMSKKRHFEDLEEYRAPSITT